MTAYDSEQCPHTVNQTLLRYLFGVCLWGGSSSHKVVSYLVALVALPFTDASVIDGCKLLDRRVYNFQHVHVWEEQRILFYYGLWMSTCDAVNTCSTDPSVENDTTFKAFISRLWTVEREHFLQGEEQLYGMKSLLYVPKSPCMCVCMCAFTHSLLCVCIHSHTQNSNTHTQP